jgi:hypothetical protein
MQEKAPMTKVLGALVVGAFAGCSSSGLPSGAGRAGSVASGSAASTGGSTHGTAATSSGDTGIGTSGSTGAGGSAGNPGGTRDAGPGRSRDANTNGPGDTGPGAGGAVAGPSCGHACQKDTAPMPPICWPVRATDSDPDACGTCGNVCAPTTIASAESPYAIAIDATSVYWTDAKQLVIGLNPVI